jgi:hypothetical protein
MQEALEVEIVDELIVGSVTTSSAFLAAKLNLFRATYWWKLNSY